MSYYKCFIIFFSFLKFNDINAQTPFEKALLHGVNNYRVKKGLEKLVYSESASVIANYQAKYLEKCIEINHAVIRDSDGGHDQSFDIPVFKEMTLQQRAVSVKGVSFIGEIMWPSYTAKNGLTEEQVIAGIINGFDKSHGHKVIMAFDFGDMEGLAKPVVGIKVIKRPTAESSGYTDYIVVLDIGYSQ
jgi:hypothetical protein